MTNYYENRLTEINMLLGLGIEANSPSEAQKLRKERDEILTILNNKDHEEILKEV